MEEEGGEGKERGCVWKEVGIKGKWGEGARKRSIRERRGVE